MERSERAFTVWYDGDGCDYCGTSGHTIEHCPDYARDMKEGCKRDANTNKSDWPL
jgi:hypothetical protein